MNEVSIYRCISITGIYGYELNSNIHFWVMGRWFALQIFDDWVSMDFPPMSVSEAKELIIVLNKLDQ